MKRLLFGSLVALGLVVSATPVWADCAFNMSFGGQLSFVHTSKSRCFSFSSHPNPLPCINSSSCSSGPALWNSLSAYGSPAYGAPAYGYGAYPAPVVAAPAATAPAATTPSFQAPQPSPATKSTTGVQQAGYFYYGQTATPAYSPSTGYNYYGNSYGYGSGYGYGYGYAQVPNYWY